jgi:hypothetical protein
MFAWWVGAKLFSSVACIIPTSAKANIAVGFKHVALKKSMSTLDKKNLFGECDN